MIKQPEDCAGILERISGYDFCEEIARTNHTEELFELLELLRTTLSGDCKFTESCDCDDCNFKAGIQRLIEMRSVTEIGVQITDRLVVAFCSDINTDTLSSAQQAFIGLDVSGWTLFIQYEPSKNSHFLLNAAFAKQELKILSDHIQTLN